MSATVPAGRSYTANITGETIYPDGGRRVLNYVMPNKQ
jgi:hypothetical protein